MRKVFLLLFVHKKKNLFFAKKKQKTLRHCLPEGSRHA